MEAFGVTPHRRVNGGRVAVRLEKRQSAKKFAKRLMKEAFKEMTKTS
jgi:hypothetical protein